MQIDTTTPDAVTVVDRATKNKYDRKRGVELVMKFRNHKDPLYYDAHANDKIFVAKHMVKHYNSSKLFIGRRLDWRTVSNSEFVPWERSWCFWSKRWAGYVRWYDEAVGWSIRSSGHESQTQVTENEVGQSWTWSQQERWLHFQISHV